MKKIILFKIALSWSLFAQAQLYNNGSSISISSATTVQVNANLTNATNGVITNNGTINLTGNLVNNQSMSVANTGTLTFAGSSTQTVSGTDSYWAKNLTINNASGVTITKALKADGDVQFQSGIVTAASASEPLIFTANGTVSTTNAPSNTSHVNGYVTKEGTGTFTYPVGDGTRYQKIAINLTANGSGLQGKYNATDAGTATLTSNLMSYNTLEHWDLSPLSTATGTVTIHWDDYNNTGITSITKLVVAHKVSGTWVNEMAASPTGNTSAGSVTSQAISIWSPFALGTISNPLPVELLSFSGINTEGGNLLTWETANEVNNKGFDIERLAPPTPQRGEIWESIGFKTANNKASTYQFLDVAPPLGVGGLYYRLRQIDNDGKETLSKVIALQSKGTKGKLSVYPNPVSTHLTIEVIARNEATEGGNFQILNLLGQQVLTGKTPPSGAGGLDVSALPQGTYFLKVGAEQVKFVKQ
jgi:hypothetical protein